ncbi:MAG: glycosyltransferase family 4 protein [Candidatus Rokuibacteriota bacterium]
MKVLTLVDLHPVKLGSLEEYCITLTEGLISRGHTSLLGFPRLPPPWMAEKFLEAGAELVELRVERTMANGIRLRRSINQRGVDIVHCTFMPIFSVLTLFMWLSGCRRVIFSDQVSRVEAPRTRLRRALSVLKNRTMSPLVDLIIADAHYIRRTLLEDHVPAAKVRVLYNGVNVKRFRPDQGGEVIRRELGIPDGAPVVTTIAAAIREKGLDTFLRAAAEVLKRQPNAVFLVVGTGPLVGDLKALSCSLGIADHVRFTGLRNDTHEILAATDIGILLSRWQEAFSFAMLEVMASGTPLVASRIGAIPEAVDDGETGILVTPDDHHEVAARISELLEDPARMRAMGHAARAKCVRHYDARKMVEATIDLYEAMVR